VTPNEIAISPDGKNAYVASQNSSSLTIYERNTTTGALAQIGQFTDGSGGTNNLSGAWGVEISSDGKFVYVTAAFDEAINVFSRNQSTGALTLVQSLTRTINGITGFEAPLGITISQDQNYLYVAAAGLFTFDGAVAVFSRNSTTGQLAYVNSVLEGSGPVVGIGAATDIVVSPDDNFVYVTGQDSDSVAVFERNEISGALTFVEAEFDGVSGVNGLDLAFGLALSEDGDYLYVAGFNDDSVAHFSVNPTTGALTYITAYTGIGGANKINIHSTGFVFITASEADSLMIYTRDDGNGQLTHLETITDGVSGVDGLDEANDIASSPDSTNIYVTGFDDNKIATFGFSGCFSALSSTFKIKKKPSSPSASTMSWKWKKGEATTVADFGDPSSDTTYTMTVSDASGEKFSLEIPRGEVFPEANPWLALSDGYRFLEKSRTHSGAYKVVLKEGEDGRSAVSSLHKGENLTAELPADLTFQAPVTVRLRNNDPANQGICWESKMSELRKAEPDMLMAR
jgi:6-phosphogluconolactonase (cycloisomerase 2 family)